jgi:antitoxin CptB
VIAAAAPEAEDPADRARRLRLRSWRRGLRETDLLLGPFADAELARLAPQELDDYEALLQEDDLDLYRWISGVRGQPSRLDGIVRRIAAFHRIA